MSGPLTRRFLFPCLLLLGAALSLAACRGGASPTPTATPNPLDSRMASPPLLAVSPSPELATPTGTASQTPSRTSSPSPSPPPTETPALSTRIATAVLCPEEVCRIPWPGVLARPVGPESQDRIEPTYPYGSTQNGRLDPHHGVEFYNPAGTPVLAAAEGTVLYAGTDDQTVIGPYPGFYGNLIILQHGDFLGSQAGPVFTLYAHLSEIGVAQGQLVDRGQEIGLVGSTGAADGAHLHFEVRLGENSYAHTTNPVLWLEPSTRTMGGTLAGVILDRFGEPFPNLPLSLDPLDTAGAETERIYLTSYYPVGLNAFPGLGENFVLADVPPGTYRLALVAGKLVEIQVTIEPGELTFVRIALD